MRRATAAIALAAALLAAAPPAGGAGLLAAARLEGVFTMSGRVTDALNIGGEFRGELVRRTWTFSSVCPTGTCPTVALTRTRSATNPPSTDHLVLRRRSPGYYTGTATFVAPVRCAGQRYAKGEAVPFSIEVRVTGAQAAGVQVIATRIRAVYRNPQRVGLTKCVSAPAHDAARYTGKLVIAPAQSTRSEPSTALAVAS